VPGGYGDGAAVASILYCNIFVGSLLQCKCSRANTNTKPLYCFPSHASRVYIAKIRAKTILHQAFLPSLPSAPAPALGLAPAADLTPPSLQAILPAGSTRTRNPAGSDLRVQPISLSRPMQGSHSRHAKPTPGWVLGSGGP
jgi:hypothetical protein